MRFQLIVAPRIALAAAALVLALAQAAPAQSVYETDLEFALREIPKACKTLIDSKGIDWKKVEKEFAKAAKDVDSDQEHWVLLTRLLARLNDGHADVQRTEKTAGLEWPAPEGGFPVGCGMFWCRSGKKILVKTVYGDAAKSGIEAGWEVVKVDDVPVQKWLAQRVAKLRDTQSFSTDHQAFFTACHWGLAEPAGATVGYEFKDEKNSKRKKNITFNRGNPVPWGPAVFPEGLKGSDDVSYGLLPSGFGYVHVRRCKGELPRQIDEALAVVGSAKGLILDFRANGGGGFDHDDFMGRFVPKGKTLSFGKPYSSTGPSPYGGPMVVIVDAGCRSAGETGAGIFKEDGRAYMIGETPTAGMSAQKTDLELPSGLFKLHVSTASNKGRFNGGKGIEGIGVVPHEIVEYQAKDLAAGVDTLTRRAEELLAKFPQNEVPYRAE